MPLRRLSSIAIIAFAAATTTPAQDRPRRAPADDGFVPLFNGKNLDGWVNVNCHPGTFFVKDGEIITTGKPTGFLRTAKQYENFVLEMDWMHENRKEVGNSGLFVWGDPIPAVGTGYTRGIEVQVLVNLEYKDKMGRVTATSHGDLFSIWGAKCVPDRPHPGGSQRCLPSEYRAKGGGEWNHYKVIANDGVIKLEVNGKEVSGVSKCNPRKGYLALESEDAVCRFKNIRIKELPSTNPKPEEIAKVDEGHVSLFNGLDLAGWTGATDHWSAASGVLRTQGRAWLRTEKKYGPFELIFDWKLPPRPAKEAPRLGVEFAKEQVAVAYFDLVGLTAMNDGKIGFKNERIPMELKEPVKPNTWARSVVRFDGTTLTLSINGTPVYRGTAKGTREDSPIALTGGEKIEIRNVFIRELK